MDALAAQKPTSTLADVLPPDASTVEITSEPSD